MAPLIGGALYDNIGYRSTCDFLAMTCVAYAVIYFAFNVGFKIVDKTNKMKEEMEALKQFYVEEAEQEYGEEDYGDEGDYGDEADDNTKMGVKQRLAVDKIGSIIGNGKKRTFS